MRRGRRVKSAKRQQGQIPRDSVLSSGAASTPGMRKRNEKGGAGGTEGSGEGRKRREGKEEELISSTHAHWAALPIPRDSPGIPHNIPSPNSPRVFLSSFPFHFQSALFTYSYPQNSGYSIRARSVQFLNVQWNSCNEEEGNCRNCNLWLLIAQLPYNFFNPLYHCGNFIVRALKNYAIFCTTVRWIFAGTCTCVLFLRHLLDPTSWLYQLQDFPSFPWENGEQYFSVCWDGTGFRLFPSFPFYSRPRLLRVFVNDVHLFIDPNEPCCNEGWTLR